MEVELEPHEEDGSASGGNGKKRRVPVDTGRLKESIDRTPVERVGSGRFEVAIVAGEGLDYAKIVEYGGVLQPVQAFVRPTARAGRKKVAGEVKKNFPKR